MKNNIFSFVLIYLHIHIHIHTYIYIYIYMCVIYQTGGLDPYQYHQDFGQHFPTTDRLCLVNNLFIFPFLYFPRSVLSQNASFHRIPGPGENNCYCYLYFCFLHVDWMLVHLEQWVSAWALPLLLQS